MRNNTKRKMQTKYYGPMIAYTVRLPVELSEKVDKEVINIKYSPREKPLKYYTKTTFIQNLLEQYFCKKGSHEPSEKT